MLLTPTEHFCIRAVLWFAKRVPSNRAFCKTLRFDDTVRFPNTSAFNPAVRLLPKVRSSVIEVEPLTCKVLAAAGKLSPI